MTFCNIVAICNSLLDFCKIKMTIQSNIKQHKGLKGLSALQKPLYFIVFFPRPITCVFVMINIQVN